ncbi:AzlC family ABC transporter permease [Alsobacter sp. KACC 23698]|uniref:AzlC family ABC transporter permease n=1 Tax=Alsobacter sp. KACC 23698 TaxID=3149229 RepID=A0AAU7JBP9_9HYPH
MSSPVHEIRDGLRDIAPAMVAAIPIGLLFGALCAGKGLSPAEVALMGGLVFAGGAQFAAVEVWRTPAPIGVLAFSTLLINARHILMGASLAPKIARFAPWKRALGVFTMADENWAMAERRALRRPLTFAYFAGTGALFWLNWVIWTTLGAVGGSFLGDPRRLGADFAFTALFIGLVAGFWKGRATAVTVAASAGASALAYVTAGTPWHVAAGALAGIVAAYSYGAAEPAAAATDSPA